MSFKNKHIRIIFNKNKLKFNKNPNKIVFSKHKHHTGLTQRKSTPHKKVFVKKTIFQTHNTDFLFHINYFMTLGNIFVDPINAKYFCEVIFPYKVKAVIPFIMGLEVGKVYDINSLAFRYHSRRVHNVNKHGIVSNLQIGDKLFARSIGCYATKLIGGDFLLPSGLRISSKSDSYYYGKNFFMKYSKKVKQSICVVRGIAKNPVDHPNGGRANTKGSFKTPWGKNAKKNK